MIHWLVQTTQNHPALLQGMPPPGLLTPVEADTFASLKTEKRRRDWLLGRWTAKRLVQQILNEHGQPVNLNQLAICNRESGEPYLQILSGLENRGIPLTISISHSYNRAVCAAMERPFGAIGIDLERIEHRAAGFVQDYFTDDEQQLVNQAAPEMQDTLITAVWSAKEAALKALHLGLRADTRAVNCLIQPEVIRPFTWTQFTIELDAARLGQSLTLSGWWRVGDDFVLTMAAERNW